MSSRCFVSTFVLVTLLARGASAQGPAPARPAPARGAPAGAAQADGAPAAAPAPDGPPHEPSAAEIEAARALFEEARRDEAARRWGEALVKFRRILATKDTASLRFHLAYCEENMGLVASAARDYERAAELAQATKGPDRKLIAEDSAKSVAELGPRVPKLTIELPAGVEGASVSVDGEPVPADKAGSALPLDPGHHTIEASAPGKRAFRREVRLVERERHTLSVLFEPAVAPAPPPARAPGPEPSAAGVRGGGGVPVESWVAAGAGVAFAGAAAGFLATAMAQRNELGRCQAGGGGCDGSEVAAASNRNLAFAGVAGGLSLAGAGAALWFALGAGSKPPARAPRSGLVIGPTGVAWRGSF
jgi:hypothetical protein